jgi:antitoxin component YwqK of YwqJK toxin-antitoxin module
MVSRRLVKPETRRAAVTTLTVFVALICLNVCVGQDSRFETPDLQPNRTLGSLQPGGADDTEGLENIVGEALSGNRARNAPRRVPDFTQRYGPIGAGAGQLQSGQDPILQGQQEEVLSRSKPLPMQYKAEFIDPDWLGDVSNSGGQSSSRRPVQQVQPNSTTTPTLLSPRLRIDGMKAIESANSQFDSSTHEIVRERYPDGKIKIVRTIAQDAEGNYYNDGGWLMYDRQQRPIASGTYVRGAMEGDWERVHESASGGLFSQIPFNLFEGPYLSRANFVRNKIDGVWTISDKSGKLICSITYENGVRNGLASWFYPSGKGKMREATFKDGVPHGIVLQWDQQGKVQRREQFVDGRRVIRKKSNFANQQLASERVFRDRKLTPQGSDDWWAAKPATFARDGEEVQYGPVAEWYPNRQPKMTGRYVDGERDGLFTWWHPSHNKKAEGSFSRGQRIGLWRYWHESGMKRSEGRFENDKPVGLWRSWGTDGQIVDEEFFSADDDTSSEPSILDGGDSSDPSSAGEDDPVMDGDPFNEEVDQVEPAGAEDPGSLSSLFGG